MTERAIVNGWWGGEDVFFVERVEDTVQVRRQAAEHACFFRTTDLTRSLLRDLRGSRSVLGVHNEGEWVRVRWRDRDTSLKGSEWLHSQGVLTFEAGISPLRRHIADTGLRAVAPRSCYLDIETDSRVPFSRKEDMRVLCWCVVDAVTGASWQCVLDEDTTEDEYRVLRTLFEVLADYDQVLAWNGDRFDFPVIRARALKAGIIVEWKRWLWLDHLELFRRMNMMAAESGDEKQSYSLQNIAMAVLGEGKDDFDSSKTWEAWTVAEDCGARCRHCRGCLARYCNRDVVLMPRIEDKTGYVALLQTLCEVTHTFADSAGVNPASQVETFLLRLGVERGVKFPSRLKIDEHVPFKGAFVMQPTDKGILRDVHVADFASLYPSIILTWNMSPETKRQVVADGTTAVAPLTGVRFAQEPQGILAVAVAELIRLRKHWNDLKASMAPGTPEWKEADRRATAYKIAANIFYGVVSSPMSRLFDKEVGESITQAGVWLIQNTIKAAEEQFGFRVVYGDTDSLFVTGCTYDEFKKFVEWCNVDLYPRLLRQVGCKRAHVKLAFEKSFERIVFVTAKRYAGKYSHYKGKPATIDSKPEIKGLEFKRGDSVRLARQLQRDAVEALMLGIEDVEHFEKLLMSYRTRVLQAELGIEDVMLSKRLSKSLNEYATRMKKDGTRAAQLPHIELARVLKDRGRDMGEGAKVDYYIVDGSKRPMMVAPAEDWDGQFDRFELWESMVWPPTQRVLSAAFPAVDWTGWTKVRPAKPKKTKAPARKRAAKGAPEPPAVSGPAPPAGAPQAPAVVVPMVSGRRVKVTAA